MATTITKINGFVREDCPYFLNGYEGEQFCGLIIEKNNRISTLYAPLAVSYRGNHAKVLDTKGETVRINVRDTNYTMPEFQAVIDDVNCCCSDTVKSGSLIGSASPLLINNVDRDVVIRSGAYGDTWSAISAIAIGDSFITTFSNYNLLGIVNPYNASSLHIEGNVVSVGLDCSTASLVIFRAAKADISFGADNDLEFKAIHVENLGNMTANIIYELDLNIASTIKKGDVLAVGIWQNGEPVGGTFTINLNYAVG